MPLGQPGQPPRTDVAACHPVDRIVDEVPDVIRARQLARAERGRRLLQLHPGAVCGPPVKLLPDRPLRYFPARAVIWIIRRTRVRTSSVRPAVRPPAGPRPGCSAAIRLRTGRRG